MEERSSRRQFLRTAAIGTASAAVMRQLSRAEGSANNPLTARPNLVFIFADQWRAQSTGYAGNKDVRTPNLDRLAKQSVNFSNAVSGCPVCTPYRGSLLTGQYWLTHGLFYNDKPLNPDAMTIGKVYSKAGYETGYIGKWHIDGHGRSSFIPEERRQGFKFWKVCECTHNYNKSLYLLRPVKPGNTSGNTQTQHLLFCSCRGVRRTLHTRRRLRSTAPCFQTRPRFGLPPMFLSH